jgi:hypothetical protein
MTVIPDPIFVIDDPPWTTDPEPPIVTTMEVGEQQQGVVKVGGGVSVSRPS